MKRRAFTLIELVLAMAACAILLSAIYSFFGNAVHLRNNLMSRTREARLRARAASVIRNDLRNAIVSGGRIAATLEGSQQSPGGSFPGYLKFDTTTATDADDVPNPDVQQVEYYIVTDPDTKDQKAGLFVRAATRNLLATTTEAPTEEPLLAGIESMDVSFYDGSDWQNSWTFSTEETTLPEAVRVRLQPARTATDDFVPPPIEVLVPWPTEMATPPVSTTGTTASGSSGTGGTP